MPLAGYSNTRAYAIAGLTGGLLAVAAVGVIFLAFRGAYRDFLVVVGVLAVLLGFVVAHRASREGRTVGQLGWALVVTTVFFTTSMAVGFCVPVADWLSRLALQFPIAFVLALAIGAVAGALQIRFGPKPPPGPPSGDEAAKSRTAQTLSIPATGSETGGPSEADDEADEEEPEDDQPE
jgi:hypothetical protein